MKKLLEMKLISMVKGDSIKPKICHHFDKNLNKLSKELENIK